MRGIIAVLSVSLAVVFSIISVFSQTLRFEPQMSIFYLLIISAYAYILYSKVILAVDDEFHPMLFLSAFAVKILGSITRFWVLANVYNYSGDAGRYHSQGIRVAEYFRNFDFTSPVVHAPQGTKGVIYITGILYSFLPASALGAYYFFGTLAFTGSVFFYMAFRKVYPDVSPRFYRLIIFFLPSILFWPSSLGKDAWVFFGSGIAAYGVALLFKKGYLKGIVWFVIGLLLVSVVRPHVAGFIVLAFGLAYLIPRKGSSEDFGLWFVRGLILLGIGMFFLSLSKDFLFSRGLDDISWMSLKEFYEHKRVVTMKGGSRFLSTSVFTIIGPFYALVTVLMRPLPWEAHNAQAMVSSLESVIWIGLFYWRRKVMWSRLKDIRGNPWVAFVFFYSIIMIMMLTTASNLGIIARQRVQFLPFLFMLIG